MRSNTRGLTLILTSYPLQSLVLGEGHTRKYAKKRYAMLEYNMPKLMTSKKLMFVCCLSQVQQWRSQEFTSTFESLNFII